METIQTVWQDLRISQSTLLQLHRELLRYSNKDERHRGEWKALNNHVAAFDADGKQIGIVVETASPFETPMLMEKLLGWHAKEEADPILHPLLRIAVFNVIFLVIQPFQDGNGSLSRVLTNLMFLRAGYAYASYTSLESVIEHNKEAYYLALRRTQTSFREAVDWEPWILFFLRALKSQIGRLRSRLAEPPAAVAALGIPDDLSPLAGQVLKLLEARDTLSVAAAALGANRHTLKDKFTELVEIMATSCRRRWALRHNTKLLLAASGAGIFRTSTCWFAARSGSRSKPLAAKFGGIVLTAATGEIDQIGVT